MIAVVGDGNNFTNFYEFFEISMNKNYLHFFGCFFYTWKTSLHTKEEMSANVWVYNYFNYRISLIGSNSFVDRCFYQAESFFKTKSDLVWFYLKFIFYTAWMTIRTLKSLKMKDSLQSVQQTIRKPHTRKWFSILFLTIIPGHPSSEQGTAT